MRVFEVGAQVMVVRVAGDAVRDQDRCGLGQAEGGAFVGLGQPGAYGFAPGELVSGGGEDGVRLLRWCFGGVGQRRAFDRGHGQQYAMEGAATGRLVDQ